MDNRVEVEFPAGWFKNPNDHPYELQCFSRNEDVTTGVFVYQVADLSVGTTAQGLLQWQIEDLQSKPQNFESHGPLSTAEFEGRTITSGVSSGERDLARYHYRFSVIEFEEHPDLLVTGIQTALPTAWSRAEAILGDITTSVMVL